MNIFKFLIILPKISLQIKSLNFLQIFQDYFITVS